MQPYQRSIWGIHAGRTGDAHTLFINNKVKALGWRELGDLSKIDDNRDAFTTKLKAALPETETGAVPVEAGQLFRFLYW